MGRRDVAEHLDLPGIGLAVALEDLHGGGLAGTVRAPQGEDLAAVDGEVDAQQDRASAVGLVEARPRWDTWNRTRH